MFKYLGHQNNDTKKNPWVVVHSHGPINNSCRICARTANLAIMLQTFWHIAEGKYELKGAHFLNVKNNFKTCVVFKITFFIKRYVSSFFPYTRDDIKHNRFGRKEL